MGLITQAISDIAQITSNSGDFGVSILLTAPDGQTATVTGLHTKTHLGIDAEGREISTKKASVAISESKITAANPLYPVRVGGVVSMTGHYVTVADSTGTSVKYMVQTYMPDEAVGLIVIILSDFA